MVRDESLSNEKNPIMNVSARTCSYPADRFSLPYERRVIFNAALAFAAREKIVILIIADSVYSDVDGDCYKWRSRRTFRWNRSAKNIEFIFGASGVSRSIMCTPFVRS